jgi:HAD superfamily hydrolase (TIGR01509 family)
VIFDIDGTLLDTNYLQVVAWWRAMRDTGHDEVAMSALHRAIGIPSDGLVRHVTGDEDEAAVEAHSERFEPLREEVAAFPRAAELLRACADAGLTVVLATSGQPSDLDWMLPAIDADDAIAGVTTAGDVEAGKPEPDLLQTAVDPHGLDAERCVVVGDTVWDVEAARKAGLPCVGVLCGGIARAELEDAGAAAVYEDPADLLAQLGDSPIGRLAG